MHTELWKICRDAETNLCPLSPCYTICLRRLTTCQTHNALPETSKGQTMKHNPNPLTQAFNRSVESSGSTRNDYCQTSCDDTAKRAVMTLTNHKTSHSPSAPFATDVCERRLMPHFTTQFAPSQECGKKGEPLHYTRRSNPGGGGTGHGDHPASCGGCGDSFKVH